MKSINVIKKLFHEWSITGRNMGTLVYFVFSVVAFVMMAVLGVLRITFTAAMASVAVYFSLSALCLVLTFLILRFANRGDTYSIDRLGYPIVVVGFIFGLTALFFADGGVTSGVPTLFIFAIVLTPCFLKPREKPVVCAGGSFGNAHDSGFGGHYSLRFALYRSTIFTSYFRNAELRRKL